ncbi:MAG TPA: hypothetical protein VEI57_11305 [Nitrospirota bacterium]|nr:hypothetical protein [Nitrospirota bacterium]
MMETVFFLLGMGFSLLVYFISIRPLDQSPARKFLFLVLTLIGITGTLFLFGVLSAHFLRKLGIHVD